VDPGIIDKRAIILAGMAFHGDPFQSAEGWSQQNEIGKLWKRFNTVWGAKRDLIQGVADPNAGYEVHIEPEEYAETLLRDGGRRGGQGRASAVGAVFQGPAVDDVCGIHAAR
jgi:hypothetical protein